MEDTIGRRRIQTDGMDPARAAALHAALGLAGAPPQAGSALPPFFHQVYFWDAQPAMHLGRDGHPKPGAFIPDMGLPRRMWAGGRLEFTASLLAGVPAERRSVILRVERKAGRTGPLGFVTMRHDIFQNDRLCVRDEQDLVYREDPDPAAGQPPPQPAPDDSAAEERGFSTTMLFRYSALTFNGHRIHYDVEYARAIEGYAGLVVHGPLLAQLLMLKAAARAPLRGFSFRGIRALTHNEAAVLNRDGSDLWIRNRAGALIMRATAEH